MSAERAEPQRSSNQQKENTMFTVKIIKHIREEGPDGKHITINKTLYHCHKVVCTNNFTGPNEEKDWFANNYITGYNDAGNIVCEAVLFCIKTGKEQHFYEDVPSNTEMVVIENMDGKTTEVLRTSYYGSCNSLK
jgi:hypothetical protein